MRSTLMNWSPVLFYGSPGCGKTLSASNWIHKINELNGLVIVKFSNSEILEEPLNKLKNIFNQFDVFGIKGFLVEDIDVFLPSLRQHSAAYQILIERLRAAYEGELIIATAQRPEALNSEELDAFRTFIPFLYPCEEDRLKILRNLLKQHSSEESLNLQKLAIETDWWSGAELFELVARAIEEPDTISINKLLSNCQKIRKELNTKQRIKRTLELLEFTKQYCNVETIREEALNKFAILTQKASAIPNELAIDDLDDVHLKDELKRAINNINLEGVDLGLFQLAKIFENELKSLLAAVQTSGKQSISKKDLSSLSNMIDAAVRIGITNKHHQLTLLREQRNERAHDKIPALTERERLLEYAPFWRDLYIEYILLFHKERCKL